jgi:hypothetical protein
MTFRTYACWLTLIAGVPACGARIANAESSPPEDSGSTADIGVTDGVVADARDSEAATIGLDVGVERLTVSTDGRVVWTVGSFPASSLVRIEVRGSVEWGDCNSSVCPDANACTFTRYGDANYISDDCFASTYVLYANTHIALEIDHRDVDWGPYSPDHVYTVTKPGNGGPFSFSYLDCETCYGDNAGAFDVLVTPL